MAKVSLKMVLRGAAVAGVLLAGAAPSEAAMLWNQRFAALQGGSMNSTPTFTTPTFTTTPSTSTFSSPTSVPRVTFELTFTGLRGPVRIFYSRVGRFPPFAHFPVSPFCRWF